MVFEWQCQKEGNFLKIASSHRDDQQLLGLLIERRFVRIRSSYQRRWKEENMSAQVLWYSLDSQSEYLLGQVCRSLENMGEIRDRLQHW